SGARWGGRETAPQQEERVVLRYEYLGRTQGLGTFHFGEQTVKDMGLLLAQSEFGQRVNSVFGEGPIRGSARFAMPSTSFACRPTSYCTTGARDWSMASGWWRMSASTCSAWKGGRVTCCRSENAAAVTQEIIRHWRERWLLPRIQRDDVLERVA